MISRGRGARHGQTLPGKPRHDRILCLLATLSSVLQLCKTAIVNRRFNHNHRPPVKQTIANFSLHTTISVWSRARGVATLVYLEQSSNVFLESGLGLTFRKIVYM